MRIHAALVLAATVLSTPAFAYNVTISGATTSNGSISGGVFTPSGPDAVLNYLDLENALATGSLAVRTGAHGTQAGDIVIARKITWAANTLTLDAYHSITIEKHVLPTSASGLGLTINDGGSGGAIIFSGGRISFDSTAQSLQINTVPYTLIDRVSTLATDIGGNPSGNFALAFNETEPTTFTSTPIAGIFTGNFEGLGNTISNLRVHNFNTTAVAMFNQLGTLATVKDLTLGNIDIQGGFDTFVNIAGLAYINQGFISNVTASGSVQDTSSTATGLVAGLVINNESPGSIINSNSSATVTSVKSYQLGGLVADNTGTIQQSYATGAVSSTTTSAIAGGLVAINDIDAVVTLCHAKGAISAVGGTLGGLAGSNAGSISQSFETGDINSSGGGAAIGGLTGFNSGSVTDSYSRGDTVGANGSTMGGFVGHANSNSSIATSYSTGGAAGGTNLGGFIGTNDADMTVTSSYWDTTTSGLSQATSNGNDSGITGLTTTQLRAGLPAGFDSMIWTEAAGVNNGLPYLINQPPL